MFFFPKPPSACVSVSVSRPAASLLLLTRMLERQGTDRIKGTETPVSCHPVYDEPCKKYDLCEAYKHQFERLSVLKLNYKPHNIYFFVAIFIARCYKYPPSQDISLGFKPIAQFGFRRRLFLSKQVNGVLFRSLSTPEVNFFPLLNSKSFVTVDIYAVCLSRICKPL